MPASRPTSRAVYRRRRLFVAFVTLVVALVFVMIVSRCAGASGGSGVSPSSSPDSGAAQSVDPTPTSESDACPASSLTIATNIVGDSVRFSAKENPQFVLSVTNSGSAACTINAGTSQITFVVTSGKQTIWKSSDCPATSADTDEYWNYPLVLQPGEEAQSTALTWPGTYSDASNCDAKQSEVKRGGGAAYWVTGSLGSITGGDKASIQFFLD